MAEKKPQTLANHARLDPLFHFRIAGFPRCRHGWDHPLSMAPQLPSGSFFVISVAAAIAVLKIRTVRAQGAGSSNSTGRAAAADIRLCPEPLRRAHSGADRRLN